MAKTATLTLRRTRRPDNPFDARLEVRLYSTEKAKLLREAADRGMTGSDLIRSQLGDLIAAPPPEPPSTAPTAQIDLAEAIAERTGVSWGYATLQIKLGRVSVNGEPFTGKTVKSLEAIEVDGEPLVESGTA